ncbi:MAG: GGDEF domain-containing protein [Myxococcota bacterium]
MSDDETTNPNQTVVTVAGAPAKDAGDRSACLVVIYGDDLGRRIPLGRETLTLGRSSRAEVQLDQESVSRTHCSVGAEGPSYVVRDLGSTNGTYVNDELVERVALEDGDQLKVGRTILKFIIGGNIEGQYHEEIYRLMTVDGLTQLNNKRYFDEAIERELSRAKRYGSRFSLLLFDIDHFKKINDTYGHLAGDAVLRQLGTLVSQSVRRDDIVARTGGEEFAVITPEVDMAGALELAEKLLRLIRETTFEFEGTRMAVTVSLGVVQWGPDHESPSALVAAADEKLYEAKRAGRDRICA